MWDAMTLKEIARACRAMAGIERSDAEKMRNSSQAQMKREAEARFLRYAADLEELAKGRS
jgi:hypothetical protein